LKVNKSTIDTLCYNGIGIEENMMFIRSVQLCFVFLLLGLFLTLRPAEIRASGPDSFLFEAVTLSQASQRETGVPASVTLAQAILESGWGGRPIADANNYFGIKASVRSDGSVDFGHIAIGWVWAWTKEWDGSDYTDLRARFRKYRDMADSFRDHGDLFVGNPRYAEAMRHVDDPDDFARQVAKAGYATSPEYADTLIELMASGNLYQYDLSPDGAQLVELSDYTTVAPGQSFRVYFEVKNDGLGIWSDKDGYYASNVNDLAFEAGPQQLLGSDVAPGGTKRWTLTMRAPSVPGTYRTQWMLKHGNKAFGPEMVIEVRVSTEAEDRERLEALLFLGSLLLALLGLRIFALRGHFTSPGEARVGQMMRAADDGINDRH
jgi:hypothetical protein